MASPCKVAGDQFDVMAQEIVLSSKHSGSFVSKYTMMLLLQCFV
jgi:hypothetical protein